VANATIEIDITKLNLEDLPFVPDCIWASLPCETYSRLAGRTHRNTSTGEYAISDKAVEHNIIFTAMTRLFRWALKRHPHCTIIIENPVGTLEDMEVMKLAEKEFQLGRVKIDYCALGRPYKKPTMIWSNDPELLHELSDFTCEKKCPYYRNKHEEQVRGNAAKLGVSAIPEQLADVVARIVDVKMVQGKLHKKPAACPWQK